MSNVRPGQLAIVVNREVLPENNGKIVKVIEEIRSGNPFPGPGGGIFWGSLDRGPFWIVESMGTPIVFNAWTQQFGAFPMAQMVATFPDRNLRPLLDTDGEDEMVTRAGAAPAHDGPPAKRTFPETEVTTK